MAESVVSFLLDNLTSFIQEEGNLLLGVNQQVKSLRKELQWIKCFLDDAEKKRRQSPLVDIWVTDLIELAYDTEDVIDAYMHHQERRQRIRRNFLNKIIHFPNKVRTLRTLGNQIKEIKVKAGDISARKSDYNLEASVLSSQESSTQNMASRRRSFPAGQEFDIVGLQKESSQIANWLNDEVSQRQVLSIVGMGGLGKTTLAQKMFKDVSKHFDVRLWISVSQEYQVKDLLSSTLKKLSGIDPSRLETMDTKELEEELCKRLDDKRYLVVIDDIWQVKAWEEISGAFPKNQKHSRVILTTRKKEVALYTDSSIHSLRVLNEDESWELFCKKVFSVAGGSCPPELVKLGKEIVDKCGGLPLAIVVIGGILMGKERAPNAWLRVLDSVTWLLSQNSNQCQQILILSYIDLPYVLKSCFMYLGHYPEDFEVKADKLILLWAAEGFVQARGNLKMEDVAEECLEDLVQRSMIQVTGRIYHGGRVETFRVHDLLRDIAILEARNNRVLDIHPNSHYAASTTRSRRLAIHSKTTTEPAGFTDPKLRSLLFDKKVNISRLKSKFGDGKRMLRVLDMEGVSIGEHLPPEIGELIFLHYLGLRETDICYLPDSIGKLVKLQTLDLQRSNIKSLPKAMWKLKNLAHLFLPICCWEFKEEAGAVMEHFGRNLLTLEVSAGFSITKDDTGPSDFLVKLRCLRSLRLEGKLIVNNVQNLRNCFPSSITELCLYRTYIEQDPSDVLGSLPSLRALLFAQESYIGSHMTFSSGAFLQLRVLSLNLLLYLREWSVADGAIPVLTHLRIESCNALNMLPDGLRVATTLQKFELKMRGGFLDRVKEDGEDWDKIKHLPVNVIQKTCLV